MRLDSLVSATHDVISQQMDGTVVLLRVSNGQYYSLNDVGCRIWALCDGTHDVQAMVTTICVEYEAPEAAVASDVLELLADLEREGLVTTDA